VDARAAIPPRRALPWGRSNGNPARRGVPMRATLSRPAQWAIALVLTALAVAICYHWLDRPIAYFSHAKFHNSSVLVLLARVPRLFVPLALLALFVLGFRALQEKAFITS
jgi:hypothetical protein